VFYESLKRFVVIGCKRSKNLAAHIEVLYLELVNEDAIRKTILAYSRIETNGVKAAEVSFFVATVCKRMVASMGECFMRCALF
jgi:hypothetical protein